MRAVIVCVVVLAVAGAYGQAYGSTLTLDPIPGAVYAGETVTFTGMLTSGGSPVSGVTVRICEDDPFIPDECLVRATTGYDGRFSVDWVAEKQAVEIELDIYAKFDGDGQYSSDRSSNRYMSVYKYGGSITLDPIPTSVAFGETIVLSGTLALDGRNPEGAIVYIQDEDTLNPDDLLTSAYVDAAGNFSTYWVVDDVDPDYTIDIRAVFEGDAKWSRQASPIQEVTWHREPPESQPGLTGGEGYMEIDRSVDFERTPRILIVPSPDSYDEVRGHIAPVQEGILQLTSMLEQEYSAGDWDVEFDVAPPGSAFVSSEPDIIISLVTRDDDSGCIDSYLGFSYTDYPKPVPAVVCSLDSRTDAQIGATAAHEFIHAIGIGHTFNIRGDMMCSTEDGVPTCPSGSKSTGPSDLNLATIAATYGTDGFQNPNNPFNEGYRFPIDAARHVEAAPAPTTNVVVAEGALFPACADTNDCFDPHTITVESGTAIIWTNNDNVLHTVTETKPDPTFDAWLLPGEEFTFTFDTPDTYTYGCTIHPWASGTVTVSGIAEPTSGQYEYEDVLWPEACFAYTDLNTCIDYYCASYWGADGFSSYDTCLADPFAYVNPYEGVVWPEDCSEDDWLCLNYYCARWWDFDGFGSYDVCLADPYNP